MIFTGLLNGVFVNQSVGIPIGAFILWLLFIAMITVPLQLYRGRVSRYSAGSIFAAANKVGGARKLFSLAANDRMDLIDSKNPERKSTVENSYQPYRDSRTRPYLSVETLHSKEKSASGGNASGGYKPNWEHQNSIRGLPVQSSALFFDGLFENTSSAKDLSKLVAMEPYLIDTNTPVSEKVNVLGRMGEDGDFGHARRSSSNRDTFKSNSSFSKSSGQLFGGVDYRTRSHSKQRSPNEGGVEQKRESSSNRIKTKESSGNAMVMGEEKFKHSPLKD